MTHRIGRSTRIVGLLSSAALCVGVVVLASPRQDTTSQLRGVAEPAPISTASPASVPTPPAAALAPGATLAPAVVVTGASVTRVRAGRAADNASAAGVPFAARRALSVADTSDATSQVAGVGATALAAYQRAAAVIDQANPTCGLDWTLLAAIGAVESDHGTYGGSTLDQNGVATPAIRGPVLDGRHHTQRVSDTDGGRLDHDARYDRALGPMQILPATWLQIAIDADGDGRRDPQDIDDAALAAGVYLCSADAELASPAGARTAVLRYNHSETYADAVLALAAGYDQDTGVPVSVVYAQPITPASPQQPITGQHAVLHAGHHLVREAVHHAAGVHDIAPAPHAILPSGNGPRHPAGSATAPALAPAEPTTSPTPTPSAPATLPGPSAPSAPSAPTTPARETPAPPSESPAPAMSREAMCQEAVAAAYPDASADLLADAADACVTGLGPQTLTEKAAPDAVE